MKLYIDTKDIEMTPCEKESLNKSLNELCFGMAALAVEFMLHTKDAYTPDDYDLIRRVIEHQFSDYFITALEKGILDEPNRDEELEKDIGIMREQMAERGIFSDEDIDAVARLVSCCGSFDAAVEHLQSLCAELGIDPDA